MRIRYIVLYILFSSAILSAQTKQWRLLWSDPDNSPEAIDHYNIYRNGSGQITQSDNPVARTAGIEKIYVDAAIQPGTRYYYWVTAVDTAGQESDFSERADATIPDIHLPDPLNIQVSATELRDLNNYVTYYPEDDKDLLDWQRVSQNDSFTISINNSTQMLTIIAPPERGRSEKLVLTVTDTSGFFDKDSTILFTTEITNTPPYFEKDIPDTTIQLGASFMPLVLDEYAQDNEDPDHLLSWSYSGNIDLIVSISPERIATITVPDASWTGSETIYFTVTDQGGLSAQDHAKFTVQDTSHAVVYAYPVPYVESDPNSDGIHFSGLPQGAKLYILDLLGKPVFEITDPPLPFMWDVTNQHGKEAGSGVYIYIIKDDKDKKIASGKLIIVR